MTLLNYGVGEDSWESFELQGDPTNPSWRRSVLGVHWKDWCWSWNSKTLATSCEELTHWKKPWCWEGLGAGEEGGNRGRDGWMASPIRWAWFWVNPKSWWWTGRSGMLRFMGSQRVGHDWVTELNWMNPKYCCQYQWYSGLQQWQRPFYHPALWYHHAWGQAENWSILPPSPQFHRTGSGSLIFQLCNVTKTKRFLFLPQWDRWQSNFSSRRVSWKSGSELSGVRERSGKLTIHTNLAFMLHLNRRIACLRKRRLNRMQKSHDIMFKMSWIQPKILHYNDNQKNDNLNERR